MQFNVLLIASIACFAYVYADSCIQCNSGTDTLCATNPEQYLARECTDATSKCYTRVKDGYTIRGCESELDTKTQANCNNEMECVMCSFIAGCNRQIFPTHRLQCIQCDGNSTGVCALDTHAKFTVCPTYKLSDQCFIRNNGRNETQSFRRGCLSTAQSQKLCVKGGNCYTCEGAGCNNLEILDEKIPVARDSATSFGISVTLLLVGFFTSRYL